MAHLKRLDYLPEDMGPSGGFLSHLAVHGLEEGAEVSTRTSAPCAVCRYTARLATAQGRLAMVGLAGRLAVVGLESRLAVVGLEQVFAD